MEHRLEEAFLLIILLKHLCAKATLPCSQFQQFTIVELAVKGFGQLFGYNVSATTQLASHTNNNVVWFVHSNKKQKSTFFLLFRIERTRLLFKKMFMLLLGQCSCSRAIVTPFIE